VAGAEPLPWEERLRELGSSSPEKGRLQRLSGSQRARA